MAQTTQEIRNKWNKDNLQHYNVSFHKTNDSDLIQFIEKRKKNGEKTTNIFREAVDALMNQE